MKRVLKTIVLLVVAIVIGTSLSFATMPLVTPQSVTSTTQTTNSTVTNATANETNATTTQLTTAQVQESARNSLANANGTADDLLSDVETTNTVGARQSGVQSTNATTMKSVNEVSTSSSNPDFGINEVLNVIIIAIGLILILLSVAILIRLK